MNSSVGNTRSPWIEHESLPKFPALDHSPEVDVCVIGAGISGLTTAYLLAKAGKSVVVLDRGEIAGGGTSRTTAHLSPVMDDGLDFMEKRHGLEGARLAWRSHVEAIDRIERIIREEMIDCDFTRLDGYLFGKIDAEFEAAKRAGIPVSKVDRAPVPGLDVGPALRFPDQAQFHVVRYLRGVLRAFDVLGGSVYADTPATDVEWGELSVVKTKGPFVVKARAIVEAANSLVTGSIRTITKLYPYRTYAMAFLLPRGEERSLVWDTEDPYHYVRSQPGRADSVDPDLLIVGGEDHKTGQSNDAEERYRRIEEWARARWPQIGAVTHRWSGQILETPDGLALIGRNPGNPENSLVITGDSGHGITHGTLGAMIVTDLVLGRENPYANLYSPSRMHPSALGTWMKENANMGRQYLDWVTPATEARIEDIPNDEGAVVRDGLTAVAVYRDANGKLSARSAACSHLGGIVQWNGDEKTWDCPCHGSRFDRYGRAIATPATKDLAPASVPKRSKRILPEKRAPEPETSHATHGPNPG